MQSIRTKFIGVTNTKPARIQAKCEAKTMTFSFHSLPGDIIDGKHAEACARLMRAMKWEGEMVGGYFDEAYYWVFVGQSSTVAKADPREPLEFTRIDNDTNGNPRYVVHMLNLCTREEMDRTGTGWLDVATKYAIACTRANAIGGRKYSTKAYGGGIVFQSYSIEETADAIGRVTGRALKAVRG